MTGQGDLFAAVALPVEPQKACVACGARATVYVMGPRSGDWADYYCDGDLPGARVALGPDALVERLASAVSA